jgi:hypothetical protein
VQPIPTIATLSLMPLATDQPSNAGRFAGAAFQK